MGRALQQKTDPGLVAMTGIFNVMNQIEQPDFLPDVPPRARALVQEVREWAERGGVMHVRAVEWGR